jgi:hypothetical protein
MKLEPECIGCLFNQVLRALKIVKPDVSRDIIISTQKELMKYLIEADINKISAPIVGGFAYNLVAKQLGFEDPYYEIKKHYNQLVMQNYPKIKTIVENAEDPLFEAIALAALGNTIDFASQHNIDLIEDINNFTSDNFKINDYGLFLKSLEKISENNGQLIIYQIQFLHNCLLR